MICINEILQKARDVTFKDLLSIFGFLIALPISFVFKIRHPDLWLICEDEKEARDNGYWFFKYVRENHSEQDVAYAINFNSPDYKKISKLGRVIQFGSLKHWVYYLTASKNISSQKGGKPNAALCYVLEVLTGLLKKQRIFLGHGITINDAKWLYYDNTKFSLFLCGAKKEKEYVEKKFGYPRGSVQYFGIPRMDNLHNFKVIKNQILVMPSWRAWLIKPSENNNGIVPIFKQTDYYKKWQEFLNHNKLSSYLSDNNLRLIFYPHRECQRFLNSFDITSKQIILANDKDYDIQQLLKDSALMITDYSSVFMDFIYMKKPVIFYQFDSEEFFIRQYQEGWFNYKNNIFSSIAYNLNELMRILNFYAKISFTISDEFKMNHNEIFPLYDSYNSKRLFDYLKHKKLE